MIKIHALNFELKKYFIACSAVQLNRAWLCDLLRIPNCKAFCQIPLSGEVISKLGAKGTIILLQDSRLGFFFFFAWLQCVQCLWLLLHVLGLCLLFWTTQRMILSEQPYNTLGGCLSMHNAFKLVPCKRKQYSSVFFLSLGIYEVF